MIALYLALCAAPESFVSATISLGAGSVPERSIGEAIAAELSFHGELRPLLEPRAREVATLLRGCQGGLECFDATLRRESVDLALVVLINLDRSPGLLGLQLFRAGKGRVGSAVATLDKGDLPPPDALGALLRDVFQSAARTPDRGALRVVAPHPRVVVGVNSDGTAVNRDSDGVWRGRPGVWEIEASGAGYEPLGTTLRVEPGRTSVLRLEMSPHVDVVAPAPTVEPEPTIFASPWLWIGVGLAVVGAGVALTVAATSATSCLCLPDNIPCGCP